VRRVLVLSSLICLAMAFAVDAFARDARLDVLVNQGRLTEDDVAAAAAIATAETEGPNTWMAAQAYDIYIYGLVQTRWTYADEQDPQSAFSIQSARIRLTGTLGEAWHFILEPEFAGGSRLLDAGVLYDFGHGRVALGQFRVPRIEETLTMEAALDTINRSAIADLLSIRDIGAFLDAGLLEGKLGVQAAVTNGTGQNATEVNDAKDYTARVWAKPFLGSGNAADGLMVAGSYSMGEHQEVDADGFDVGDFDHSAWAATLRWTWEQLKVQGEYVDIERDRGPGLTGNTTGWYAYGTYNLPLDDIVVTPVVRYDTRDPNETARTVCGCAGGEWITLGVRVSFVGIRDVPVGIHDVKLEANYILENLDEGEDVDELILQLTASF
jgi:hypothetical protein